jgi:hypothetical protein
MDSTARRALHQSHHGREARAGRVPAIGMKAKRVGKFASDAPSPEIDFGNRSAYGLGLSPTRQGAGLLFFGMFRLGRPNASKVGAGRRRICCGAVDQPHAF